MKECPHVFEVLQVFK